MVTGWFIVSAPRCHPLSFRRQFESEAAMDSGDSIRERSKQHKSTDEKTLDYISVLHDFLLIHILSFLSAKDAVKTHTLSKRWRFLWTHTPVLNFHFPDPEDDDDDKHVHYSINNLKGFESFVNNFLSLYKSPKIKKFRIRFDYRDIFVSSVNDWLHFAMDKNVEELELDFYEVSSDCCWYGDSEDGGNTCYEFPVSLLRNLSLQTLKLYYCDINLFELMHMKSLKVLSICDISLSKECIEGILSTIPSLEVLELCGSLHFESLNIKSTGLRKLFMKESMWDLRSTHSLTLKISAPNLQSLEISGPLDTKRVYLIISPVSSSLVDVKLSFKLDVRSDHPYIEQIYGEYSKIFKSLLENLRHVKDLTIGRWCLQALLAVEDNSLPCPLSTVGCLRLQTDFRKWDLPVISKLLASTPALEMLVIDFDYLFHNPFNDRLRERHNFDVKNYWSSRKTFFALALQNLKTVKFSRFNFEEHSIEFILFLLKDARQLEKMAIHIDIRPSYDTNLRNFLPKISQEIAEEITQRILRCPRCSPNAVVVFY